MSIIRNHGVISFECNACNDVLETEYTDFYAALAYVQREGWQSTKHGNDWRHYCPDCELRWDDEEEQDI